MAATGEKVMQFLLPGLMHKTSLKKKERKLVFNEIFTFLAFFAFIVPLGLPRPLFALGSSELS